MIRIDSHCVLRGFQRCWNWSYNQMERVSIGMLDVISPPICLSCQRKMVVTTKNQSPLICRQCRLTWNAAQRELCEVCALPRPVFQCREGQWIRLACSHCVTTDFSFFQAYVLSLIHI